VISKKKYNKYGTYKYKYELLKKIIKIKSINFIPNLYYNVIVKILIDNIEIKELIKSEIEIELLYNKYYEFYKIIDFNIEHYGEQIGITLSDTIKQLCIYALFKNRTKFNYSNNIDIIISYYDIQKEHNKKIEELKNDFSIMGEKYKLKISNENINNIILNLQKKDILLSYILTHDNYMKYYNEYNSPTIAISSRNMTIEELRSNLYSTDFFVVNFKIHDFELNEDEIKIFTNILFYNNSPLLKNRDFDILIYSTRKFIFILQIVSYKLKEDGYENPSTQIIYSLINDLWNKNDYELDKIISKYNKIKRISSKLKKEKVQNVSNLSLLKKFKSYISSATKKKS